ncbi:hypothetical protein BT69DRAFT_1286047 [Atractiella rhizophila]|nr:hypothetical protein BT69DRAFT_1286047 [Atractiella rhizophila]
MIEMNSKATAKMKNKRTFSLLHFLFPATTAAVTPSSWTKPTTPALMAHAAVLLSRQTFASLSAVPARHQNDTQISPKIKRTSSYEDENVPKQ